MRNNNNLYNNFFFGFEIKSVTNVSCGKPDVACHSLSRPPMYVKLIYVYMRVLRNFNSGLGYFITAAAPQFACRVRF